MNVGRISSFLTNMFTSAYNAISPSFYSSTDLTVTSLRYSASPIVNRLVNNYAFLPPDRPSRVLHELMIDPTHDFVSNNKYTISFLTSKPKFYKSNRCILFSHGNASDVLSMNAFCNYWANMFGMDCICYDYLGYGLSKKINTAKNKIYSTTPSEDGCYISLKIMMDHLKTKYDVIYMIGQSLGTGVCVDYCAKYKWETPIVLVSPYKSIARVIADTQITSIIDSSFNTYEKINRLKCPVKIFHGESDTIIHISHGKEIYDALPDKTFQPVWLKNIGHNDILENIAAVWLFDVFES